MRRSPERRLVRAGERLAARTEDVQARLVEESRFRVTIPIKRIPREQSRLHRRRGSMARREVNRILRQGQRWLASLEAYLSPSTRMLGRDVARCLRAQVDHLEAELPRAGDRMISLLVTDQCTWDRLIVPLMETHDPADVRLRRLHEQRSRIELSGHDIDSSIFRRGTSLTLEILSRLAEGRDGAGTSRKGAGLAWWVTAARARLDLVSEIEGAVADVRARAEDCHSLIRQRTEPPPAPAPEVRSEEEPDLAWVQDRAVSLHEEVAATVAAYTISNAQLRELGWASLRRQLTSGVDTDAGPARSYPKAEVKRFLGLLKLVHAIEGPDAERQVAALLDAECRLRSDATELLRFRHHLEDANGVVEDLGALHLEWAVNWTRDEWEDIAGIVSGEAPKEARWLETHLVKRSSTQMERDA